MAVYVLRWISSHLCEIIVSISETNFSKLVKIGAIKYHNYNLIHNILRRGIAQKKQLKYEINKEGLLMYKTWLYVPNEDDIKRIILTEYHKNPYATNLGY